METGICKWFNENKGFGFVTLDNGSDIFIHFSGIEMEGYKTLTAGDKVEIDSIEESERGPYGRGVRKV